VKIQSSRQAIQVLERLARTIDLVSFDVFDTLIQRCIWPPEKSKVPAAREVCRLLAEKGLQVSIEESLDTRLRIEQRLGQSLVAKGKDWDCPIVEVCQGWLQHYLGREVASPHVERIVEAEIKGEKHSVHPVEGMLGAVKKARQVGKRVVCVSDMYLTQKHIMLLLTQCGYAGLIDCCYVSSEYGLRKRTGRLFRQVLAEEATPASRWVHFGDNFGDDYLRPKQLGARAYHFMPEEQKTKRDRFSRLERLSRIKPLWSGASLVEMHGLRQAPRRFAELPYEIGFWLLGPVLANFVHRVIERVNHEDIELVLFPAREGFVLQDLFQKFAPYALGNKAVMTRYCFLTRSTTFGASADHLGLREVLRCFLATQKPCARTMLTRLGADVEAFQDLARQCGLGSIDRKLRSPFHSRAFLRFIYHPEFRRLLKENHRKYKSLLDNYLEQEGFWQARRVALVDVGWQGTVQDALTCAFGERHDWPRLFGLYMGFVGNLPFLQTPVSTYEGILYHRGKEPHGSSAFERFVQLFEFSTRAPHPTSVSLRKDINTGRIVPVLKNENEASRLSEVRDRTLLTSLQAGIFDYADVYAKTIPSMDKPPEYYSPYLIQVINRFIRFPRADEAKVFSHFRNIEDFGADHILRLSNPRFRLCSVGKWWQEFNMSVLWKEGLIASCAGPCLVILYNLWLSLKQRSF